MFNKIGTGLAILGIISLGVGFRFVRSRSRKRRVTGEEVDRPLLGDDVLPNPDVTATRAETIELSPEQVRPAILQVGSRRDFQDAFKQSDHGSIPVAEGIRAALQQSLVSQVIGKEGFTTQASKQPQLFRPLIKGILP